MDSGLDLNLVLDFDLDLVLDLDLDLDLGFHLDLAIVYTLHNNGFIVWLRKMSSTLVVKIVLL